MSRAKSKEIPLRWRTDFRIPDALPDIKVVRTNFLINFIGIGLLMGSLFHLAQREYTIGSLREAVGEQEGRISASTATNRQSVEMNRRFVAGGRRVEEMQRFFASPVAMHQFLAELAIVRPDDIVFRQLSLQPNAVQGNQPPTFRVEIRGDARELAVLNELKTLIEGFVFKDPNYQAVVTENVQPRTAEGTFPYTIDILIRQRP